MVPVFKWIVMEPIDGEEPDPIAGFNNEGDVEELIRQVEASEGFEPILYKWNEKARCYEVEERDNLYKVEG